MGLERMAAILQGKTSNYDTDLMRTLIMAVATLAGVDPDGPQAASHRIIADHLRACAFLMADGVDPSNEGRGYVLRRIMRRAMRHAQLLGAAEPLMWRLVPVLVREMGQAYPELVQGEQRIAEILQREEARFRVTLARGLTILEDETRGLSSGARLPGEVAFKLYDTYGFPLDLTQDALRGRGMSVDDAGFSAAMERQRADARKAWTGSGEAATETVWFGLRDRLGPTEFLGYATERAEGIVTGLVAGGTEAERIGPGESGFAIVNQTPFYAESGGQGGDTGTMSAPGLRVLVTDTLKKLGDVFVHAVTVAEGTLSLGTALDLVVDGPRRTAIRANHSATHILHEALRQVLGPHVAQKGSSVDPERLRFDFSHQKPISEAELAEVEDIANAVVLQNEPVVTRLMGIEEARGSGARALFGEKYGEEVRVVSMGRALGDAAVAYSIGIVRRHARPAHGRHRAHQRHGRELGLLGRPAHRGTDGHRRAAAPQCRGDAVARARSAAEGEPGQCGRAAAGTDRGSAQTGARGGRRPQASRDGRRRCGGHRRGGPHDRRRRLLRANGERHRAQGPQGPRRRGEGDGRFGRRRHRRRRAGRQGGAGGRGDARSRGPL